MKVWIEKPVSEPPENNGTYGVIYEHDRGKFRGSELYFNDGHWLNGNVTCTEWITHYLIPIEANVLTDEELEKKISDAWNAGGRSTYDSIQPEGACGFDHKQHSSDKTEYLKQLNNG